MMYKSLNQITDYKIEKSCVTINQFDLNQVILTIEEFKEINKQLKQ
jgi:hypothetical protein